MDTQYNENDFKLVKAKDDTCDECFFSDKQCPDWAHAKCDTANNHVWQQDTSGHENDTNEKKDENVWVQLAGAGCGCLFAIIIAIVSIIATAWVAAWICHRYFM